MSILNREKAIERQAKYIERKSANLKQFEEKITHRKAESPYDDLRSLEETLAKSKEHLVDYQARFEEFLLDEEPFEDPIESLFANKVLEKAIREAFAGAAVPADLATRYSWPEAPEEEKESLKGRRWAELTIDDIWFNDLWLHHLDDEYFRYYLPAFLLAALEDYDLSLSSRVVYELNPYPFGVLDSDEWKLPRLEGLADAQRAAIRAFLFVAIEAGSIAEGEKAEELRQKIDKYFG